MTTSTLDERERQIQDELARIQAEKQAQAQQQQEPILREKSYQKRFRQRLGDMIRLVVLGLAVFGGCDWLSGSIESGTGASMLFYIGQFGWLTAMSCMALVTSIMLVLPSYRGRINYLTDDWNDAGPAVRLALVVGLIIGILHFLTAIMPHTKT